MAIPDKLVTVATEAVDKVLDRYETTGYTSEQVAEAALKAAFAALPEWIKEELSGSIVSGVHPQWFAGFDYAVAYLAQKATTDD